LNKSVKIKTIAVLFAWTVIFIHGVIPHLHQQDHNSPCNSIIHEINSDKNDTVHSLMINGKPGDHEKVCHYTGLLFQLLNYDNLLFHPEKKTYIVPVILSESHICQIAYLNFSEPETDTTSLRAPPVS
jgi:hypothetical protein